MGFGHHFSRVSYAAGPVAATRGGRACSVFGWFRRRGPWRRAAVEMGPLTDSPAACARRRWQ
jgi:hypothetical protein